MTNAEKPGAAAAPKGTAPKEAKAPKAANIYQRIHGCQNEVGRILKLGENKFHGYKYAYERDYLAEIKPLLGRHGIAITHDIVETKFLEGNIAHTRIAFTLVNIDNPEEKIIAHGEGTGQDVSKDGKPGDKALPKALTMAVKYFLAKTFLIETGDDAEQDDRKGSGAPTSAKAAAKANPAESVETILRMIASSRNAPGLDEYRAEKLPHIKAFSEAQKKQISDAITSRINHLDAE